MSVFPERCRSLGILLHALGRFGSAGPGIACRRIAHQTRGLAGTVGFPAVSERAAELEQLIVVVPHGGADTVPLHAALERMRAAFESDLRRPAPEWALPFAGRPFRKILVSVDDSSSDVLTVSLRNAAYRLVRIERPIAVFDRARVERPDLVLLDLDLRGIDAFAICRRLKTSVDLMSTPVLLLRSTPLKDRRTELGPDGHLIKPVDGLELVRRIEQLLDDRGRPREVSTVEERLLSYEAFVYAAQALLDRAPATLALVSLPRHAATLDALVDGAGSLELACRFNDASLLVLMPEPRRLSGLMVGIATSTVPRVAVEELIRDADRALHEAGTNTSRP